LAIRLRPELESRLSRLARLTGRTKTFYARQAIEEHMTDLEDAYQVDRACDVGSLSSQAEVEKMLGVGSKTIKPTVSFPVVTTFCQEHEVARFYLFGSILRDDFSASSDVDVLLDMGKCLLGYDEHFEMVEKLKTIFGRSVDMVDERVLKSGRTHPSIVANIMKSRKLIYVAPWAESKKQGVT